MIGHIMFDVFKMIFVMQSAFIKYFFWFDCKTSYAFVVTEKTESNIIVFKHDL